MIQRIAAEDSDIPPVVCLNGTTETLPISEAYGRFVRRGTGMVAKLTGHDSYRIDLDRPVDGGSSWQLGILLAHLLQAEGRLAGPEETAEVNVFATGEVDRDLFLRPVGHIERKLLASDGPRQQVLDAGSTCLFLVPADDAVNQPAVTPVATLAEAAKLIDLTLPADAPGVLSVPAPPEASKGRGHVGRVVAAGFVLVLLTAAAGLYWQRDRIVAGIDSEPANLASQAATEPLPANKAPEKIQVTVQPLSAPEGFTCRSLRFAQLSLVEGSASPLTAGQALAGSDPEICRLRYGVAPGGQEMREFQAVWRAGAREETVQGSATPTSPLVLEVDVIRGQPEAMELEVRSGDDTGASRTWRHSLVP